MIVFIFYQKEFSQVNAKFRPTSYSASTRDLIIQFFHEVSMKVLRLVLRERTDRESLGGLYGLSQSCHILVGKAEPFVSVKNKESLPKIHTIIELYERF